MTRVCSSVPPASWMILDAVSGVEDDGAGAWCVEVTSSGRGI